MKHQSISFGSVYSRPKGRSKVSATPCLGTTLILCLLSTFVGLPALAQGSAGRALAAPAAGAAANPLAVRTEQASLRSVLMLSVPWDPQVRVAAAAQRIAQERLAQSKSRLWPTLGLSATAGQGNFEDFGVPVRRTIDRAELLLRWNVYAGGADSAEITASEREWAAATADLQQNLDLVAERVSNAYLDVWRWQSLLEPSLARLKSIERWVEQARVQMRAGRLSDADLQQIEYSMLDAQLAHQNVVSEHAGALANLQVLVGRPLPGVQAETLPQISAEELRGMTPAGIRVAQLRAEAAQKRVLHIATLAAPRVDLDARKSLSDQTTPRLSSSEQKDGWSVGIRWEMPLGGESFSRRREQIARVQGAEAEVERLEQGLRAELAAIRPRLLNAEQAVLQLQSQAEQYNSLLRAGRVQFDAGRRSLPQLIQLEDGRMNVLDRLAEQNNRLDRLRVRLLVLAGRLSSSMGLDPAPPGARKPG